ncbi:VRR-NUC domain-containing protein [Vibrio mexicanus]|uniref:VRR-NUC domain-containing protein n=1 Tax=Vibrio mexicanus TaxID=1004326 RepID=UPI00063CB00C|nr:VRR-NUC domain-containing protein [Vibrio mexicanus]
MTTPTPELAPDYYLDNFQRLINHALKWYQDLLNAEESEWVSRFNDLTRGQQCLLVRLFSRKGLWFRSDKLDYEEIKDIPATLFELDKLGFISINPEVSNQSLAHNLLTKPETLALFPDLNKRLSKLELIASLSDDGFQKYSSLNFDVVYLNAGEMIDLLLALFFANTHQDLTQFVLDDLGLHQYEKYQLSKERRFFHSREQVDTLLSLSAVAKAYQQGDRKSIEHLDSVAQSFPSPISHPYVERRRQHLINDLARDFERLAAFDVALKWFQQSALAPSRERQARIFDKLDRIEDFERLVAEMLGNPLDESEYEVAVKLEQRLRRKQGQKVPRSAKPRCHEYHIELDLSQQRVELATKDYFESLGWEVYYSENVLLNALFGLTFWEAIFAPIEGAFINQYQYKPLDLYHHDFKDKRSVLLEEGFSIIRSQRHDVIIDRLHQKNGINNPFVFWGGLNEELIKLALKHVSPDTLIELFEVQLRDLKLYRNGMPDLIAFKDGEYRWIEVKGPGDKLQDNQWRWIKRFNELDVPFSVCYVAQFSH